jgi:type IV pilus assembly protein PilV
MRYLHSRRAAGFTIAEVLVALLVVAVAVIGIAALYADAEQSQREEHLRLRAAELASEIARRIEANAAGRVGYISTVGVVCKPNLETSSAVDAAANEAACWKERVEQSLPSGLGTIRRDTSTTPVTYHVAVSWSAPNRGAASYVVQVKPAAD